MAEIILLAVGGFLIIASAIPLFKHESYWVRSFDFPRLQFLTLLLLIFVAYAIFVYEYRTYQVVFLVLLLFSMILQGYAIFPYTVFSKKQVKRSKGDFSGDTISLMVSNVLMYNKEVDPLKKIVDREDPDLLLLVETNQWWKEQMKDYEERYNHHLFCPLENTYGMLLYSKLELKDSEIAYLVEEDVPSMHGKVVLRSGQEVHLHCLHPRPPSPTENEESTERDAELVLVGKKVRKHGGPAIVLGDLNDVAWSHTSRLFQRISGLLDPRIGRGFYNTFNARYPVFRWPLDHVFHSNHFKLVHLSRLPYCCSDHFPIGITLAFNPDAQEEQEKPRPDKEDREEAREKLKKAGI